MCFAIRKSATLYCLYERQLPQSYVPDGKTHQHIDVMIESDDGVSGHNPDLTARAPLPVRVCPNRVLPLAGFGGHGPRFYMTTTPTIPASASRRSPASMNSSAAGRRRAACTKALKRSTSGVEPSVKTPGSGGPSCAGRRSYRVRGLTRA